MNYYLDFAIHDATNFSEESNPNNMAAEDAEYAALVAKMFFSALIFIVGVVGNTLVIFVIFVLREFRKSVTHWYVLQLAIADSLFLLSLPFKWTEDINKRWIYPEWMCKGKETMLFLNYNASCLVLVVMSLDRYIAVCHSFTKKLQRLRKLPSAFIITCVMWGVCLLCCIPVMMYSVVAGDFPNCQCSYIFPPDSSLDALYQSGHTYKACLLEGLSEKECAMFSKKDENGNSGHCFGDTSNLVMNWTEGSGTEYISAYDETFSNDAYSPVGNSTESYHNSHDESTPVGAPIAIDCTYENAGSTWKAFLMFNFTVMFIFPVLVMAASYGLIIRHLSTTHLQRNSPASSTHLRVNNPRRKRKGSTKSDNNRKRITWMCVSLVACFVVLWLPFHVGHLAKLSGISLPKEKGYICRNLSTVGTLLAYLNSALNPYLYSFLGGSFRKRWQYASVKVKRSMRGSSNYASSAAKMRFAKRRQGSCSNSNTGTTHTSLNRNLAKLKELKSDANPSGMATGRTSVAETQQNLPAFTLPCYVKKNDETTSNSREVFAHKL